MKTSERILSLDLLRGVAMMFVVFFHAAIYNFANIHLIDFSDPPLLIVLMSFMALWGGIFIVYSMTVNAIMLARRRGNAAGSMGAVKPVLWALGVYVVLHYVLNLGFGRWNIDFVNNRPHLPLIAALFRGAVGGFRVEGELFEGSSLATIGLNLLLIGGLVRALLARDGGRRARGTYWLLGGLGTAVMLLSFVRVGMYPLLVQAKESGNYAAAIGYSFVLANPYPLIPYLGYGCLGAMAGLMIHDGRRDLLKRVVLPLGGLFLVYGLSGMARFDKTISTPDFFWYFKTNLELGLFLLLLATVYLTVRPRPRRAGLLAVPLSFSRVSLTIYMLETTMSELLSPAATAVLPGWNQTINGCLAFGAANVAVWAVLLCLWRRGGFRYGLEHLWVLLMRRAGKESTKLDGVG